MRLALRACCIAMAPLLATAAATQAADYRLDKLTVLSPWSRATAGPDSTGVGYMIIRNDGEADQLVGVVCEGADVTSLHDDTREPMTRASMSEGRKHVMTTLYDIPVPAHADTALKPGGLHLMLENMAYGLDPGRRVHCILRFKNTGPIDIKLLVGPAGATTPPADPPGGPPAK